MHDHDGSCGLHDHFTIPGFQDNFKPYITILEGLVFKPNSTPVFTLVPQHDIYVEDNVDWDAECHGGDATGHLATSDGSGGHGNSGDGADSGDNDGDSGDSDGGDGTVNGEVTWLEQLVVGNRQVVA